MWRYRNIIFTKRNIKIINKNLPLEGMALEFVLSSIVVVICSYILQLNNKILKKKEIRKHLEIFGF